MLCYSTEVEIKTFTLAEAHRKDMEILLEQLSGKQRRIDIHNPPNCFYIGAFEESRLVGFVQFFILEKTTFTIAHVEDLIVHSQYRGAGLGQGLMETAIAKAREEKAEVINLTTRKERESAWKLFEKLGFRKEDNHVLRLRL